MLTKFDLAYKAVYNAAYAEFVRTLDAAEGVDAAHLVTAHGYAAFKADRAVAECKCYGTGLHWSKGPVGPDGVQKPVSAVCYGCGGKGYQNDADQRRNWGYHTFYYRLNA